MTSGTYSTGAKLSVHCRMAKEFMNAIVMTNLSILMNDVPIVKKDFDYIYSTEDETDVAYILDDKPLQSQPSKRHRTADYIYIPSPIKQTYTRFGPSYSLDDYISVAELFVASVEVSPILFEVAEKTLLKIRENTAMLICLMFPNIYQEPKNEEEQRALDLKMAFLSNLRSVIRKQVVRFFQIPTYNVYRLASTASVLCGWKCPGEADTMMCRMMDAMKVPTMVVITLCARLTLEGRVKLPLKGVGQVFAAIASSVTSHTIHLLYTEVKATGVKFAPPHEHIIKDWNVDDPADRLFWRWYLHKGESVMLHIPCFILSPTLFFSFTDPIRFRKQIVDMLLLTESRNRQIEQMEEEVFFIWMMSVIPSFFSC